jgi:hypothetical protein
MTKNYILLRVHLKDSATIEEVTEAALIIQDFLIDNLDPKYGECEVPQIFTQDVTMEVHTEEEEGEK